MVVQCRGWRMKFDRRCGPNAVRAWFGHPCGLPWDKFPNRAMVKDRHRRAGVIDDAGGLTDLFGRCRLLYAIGDKER
jgi:hypothetical protein